MDHNARIWEAVRNREEAVFKALYFRCYDLLFKYGIQKLDGDQMRVAAVINEVFAEIWERGPALPPVENIEGYLFIMFKRKLFRDLKQTKAFRLVPDSYLEKEMETTLSYENLLIKMQTEEVLKKKITHALEALTPRQLEIIRLKYFQELSIKEISHKLQLAPRTIYNTLHRGLKILRNELEALL